MPTTNRVQADPYACRRHPNSSCFAAEAGEECEPLDPDLYDEEVARDEAEYEAWYAVQAGRATALMRCYLCALDQGHQGLPSSDDGPLRGVLQERTVDVADPTAAFVLTPCGHVVIDL